MKKNVFLLAFLFLCLTTVKSQLLQDSNGNVGIKAGNGPYISYFTIGNEGYAGHAMNIHIPPTSSMDVGLRIKREGTSSAAWLGGFSVDSEVIGNKNNAAGTLFAVSSTAKNSGRAYGLISQAGNSTPGYNYGVLGNLRGELRGAGIVGSVNTYDLNIDGIYAGYFNGNVKVTGTITGTLLENSDARLKQDISFLGNELKSSNSNHSVLNKVSLLEPIEYKYKQIYTEGVGDSTVTQYGFFDENSQLFEKKQYGLIAQDVQELFPDLVYEQDNGYLAINYTGLIPLLIQSIKELREEIKEKNSTDEITFLKNSAADKCVLYQNSPNPFSHATQISYYLQDNITNAFLIIYELQGKQIKSIQLNDRGEGSIVINGNDLAAGMYLYALIADGEEVDVKRMILID